MRLIYIIYFMMKEVSGAASRMMTEVCGTTSCMMTEVGEDTSFE